MFAALIPKAHTATKRLVIYSACVSLIFLGSLWFSFHQGWQAGNEISAKPAMSGAQAQLVASFGKLPLSFEANQGQADGRVKFLSHGHGYALFLTGDETVLELQEPGVRSQKSESKSEKRKTKGENQVVRLRLVGGKPNAEVSGQDELAGKVNYFIGNDPKKWHANVPTYAKVKYRSVYPGIDLLYYGNPSAGGQLEYDFIVAPGADANAIALDVRAVRELPLRIDAKGDLVIPVKGGEVRFNKPVVYQPGSADEQRTTDNGPLTAANPKSKIENPKSVEGHFRLDAQNRVRFELGPYDHSRPLVIDPALTFSTYLGGSGAVVSGSSGKAIAIDHFGYNVYITGSTSQTDFPTLNPLQKSLAGGENVFVAKLTPAGALIFSTYLGGGGEDVGESIAVDLGGDIYVTGATSSSNFPLAHPLEASPKSVAGHAFVSKLNTIGSVLLYSTYLGGSSSDIGNGITVDGAGNVTVVGNTTSADFPMMNPIQANPTGAFVSKLNADGSAFIYSTFLGGSTGTSANAVALDTSGDAFVTGSSAANFPVTPGAYQTSCTKVGAATSCVYVTEVNAAGTVLVYATYLSGSNDDVGTGIAVDTSGNAYVTGYTTSPDFPSSYGAQPTLAGLQDAFVSKLNANGTALVYSSFLGGSQAPNASGITVSNAIALDVYRQAYVTGWTNTTDFPLVDPIQTTNNAVGTPDNQTAFVTEFDQYSTTILYSTYLGGNVYDVGSGIATDLSENAWVIGSTSSTTFPMVNPLKATNTDTWANQTVAFVSELSQGPVPAVSLSAPALSFPGGFLKVTSAQQSVTLTNLGNAVLNISGLVATGDFALVNTATSCPYLGGTVAALANCTIDVTFTPEATGARAGSVAITDNAGGSPQAVQLSGTGDAAVAVTVSPVSLSFGNQLIGTPGTPQGVTVTNPGAAAISISSLTISNGWTETDNCLPAIPANSSCNIRVVFAPTASGNQTGTLTLTDDATNSPQLIALSGTALAPVVTLSATSLSFSSQNVSTTSAPQTILLTNTGTGALTPLTMSTSGDFAETNNCTVPINPGTACTIGVTFTPTTGGVRNGTLTLTDNAVNSPQTVTLTGTGLGAMASLSPTSLSFGSMAVGSTSASQTITLTNPANNVSGVPEVPGIQVSGDFQIQTGCESETVLTTNSPCPITVTFTPTAAGMRTGALTVTYTSPVPATLTATLTGTGVGAVASFSATSLTFAAQTVSTQSAAQTITLTNTGNAALTPLTIARNGSFAEKNTCPASLSAGANCTISVIFSPTGAGSQSGTITVTDNALGSPQTIALSGTGIDFALTSTTTSQTVSAGQTANYSLTLSPEDGFSQTVNLACTGAPTLATCTLTPNSATVSGTASATVAVAVSTTAPSTAWLAPPAGRSLPPGSTGLERMFWLYALLGLASLATLAAARKRRAAYLVGACLLLAMLWTACGGGSSTPAKTVPGTPAGTYTVVVTGTAASTSTLTHTINLTLTVN